MSATIETDSPRRSFGLAVVAALVLSLSAPPLSLAAFGFLGTALLYRATLGAIASPERAFLVTFVAGFAINAIELGWVMTLLVDYGHFPWLAALPTAGLLFAAQSLNFGAAGAITAALARRGHRPTWVFPAALTVASALLPALFPWQLAESQLPFLAYAQMADLGGEPLVNFALALTACAAHDLALPRQRRAMLLVLALSFAAPIAYGLGRIAQVEKERSAAPHLVVGVVQPNVTIEEKRQRRRRPERLARLRRASLTLERAGAELVVWPETSYPYPFPRDRARDFEGEGRVREPESRIPLLFGAITEGVEAHYNSVVAMDAHGRVTAITDKVVLLAFGEYVPFYDFLPSALSHRFPRGLTPGDRVRSVDVGGTRVGVLNCYEDILPSQARRVALDDPGFLLNVTNDAWFGHTMEPELHHLAARYRAIETRRDLVRAVNTGVSAWVLATGEDAVHTPIFEERRFLADVPLLMGKTFFTRFGDLVTPSLFAALVLAALSKRRYG